MRRVPRGAAAPGVARGGRRDHARASACALLAAALLLALAPRSTAAPLPPVPACAPTGAGGSWAVSGACAWSAAAAAAALGGAGSATLAAADGAPSAGNVEPVTATIYAPAAPPAPGATRAWGVGGLGRRRRTKALAHTLPARMQAGGQATPRHRVRMRLARGAMPLPDALLSPPHLAQ